MALVNLAVYEAHALEVISGSVLDYYDGGANDEITLRENPAAFGPSHCTPECFVACDNQYALVTSLWGDGVCMSGKAKSG